METGLTKSESEYRTSVMPYLMNCGLVSHEKGKESGNGWIYTAMHYYNLKQRGWLRNSDIENIEYIYYSCCVKDLGLVQRSPTKPDLQSHDDLTAIVFLFNEVGYLTSKLIQIRNYSKRTFKGAWWSPFGLSFVYNTETPGEYYTPTGKCAWLGRYRQVVAHMDYADKRKPSVFDRMIWSYTVSKACSKELSNQDSWILTWFLCKTGRRDKNQHNVIRRFERAYLERFKNYERGGIDGLFTRCLQENHPVGKIFVYTPILD